MLPERCTCCLVTGSPANAPPRCAQGGLHLLEPGRCTCCLSRMRVLVPCGHQPRCQHRRAAGAAAAEGWQTVRRAAARTPPVSALCLLPGGASGTGAPPGLAPRTRLCA